MLKSLGAQSGNGILGQRIAVHIDAHFWGLRRARKKRPEHAEYQAEKSGVSSHGRSLDATEGTEK